MAQYHLKIDGSNASAIDAYLEYSRIVGDDDGGKLFTPEEYERYKKEVIPIRMKNRLYTCWTGPIGMDCKLIGPETNCFCNHRYKQHKTDFEKIPDERPILLPCRQKGCKCASFHYAPLNGSQPIRCSCKHMATEHSEVAPYMCKRGGGCSKCVGFSSSFTCGCGAPVKQHKMIVETAEEREARGHPLGEATPYAAMGAPPKGYLEQSITSSDHPFLRANVQSIKAHQMKKKAAGIQGPDDEIFDDITERVSQMKRPGEDDMAYYERRYQERLKAGDPTVRPLNQNRLQAGNRKAIQGKTSCSISNLRYGATD
ncbi:hypothetical protein KUTeg_022871, partial [Tegillarca granosa]